MFGISTHLYLSDRLDRDHLVEIAAHGFEAVEVFAVRDHFDYHDRRAALALTEWLDDTRLTLPSMHAPHRGGRHQRRLRAVKETTAALNLATLVPYQILVLHCGLPAPHGQPADNQVASMIRSLEQLSPVAAERRPILERAVKARARFEALLAFGDEPPIETAVD